MIRLYLTILCKSSQCNKDKVDGMTCRLNPEVSAIFDENLLVDGLNAIAWTSEERRYLEDSILSGPIATFCYSATPDVSHNAVLTAHFST